MLTKIIKFAVIGSVIAGVFLAGISLLSGSVSSRQIGTYNGDELWRDIDESLIDSVGERQIVPESYRTIRLSKDILRVLLEQAPRESSPGVMNSESVISLPLPDGKFSRFRFVESPIMEDALQAKFPEIRTYLGQGIDEPGATVRFDVTPSGFHGLVLSENASVYIDPYSKGDTENYISYYKHDFQKPDRSFRCLVGNEVPNALEEKRLADKLLPDENLVNNAGTLRTYRLAMAATGEYTQFHGGTVAGALAAIATTMNRINGVYERDLSVRMTLIANNNLIIYTNPATDPYTNSSGDLGANQTNIDLVIGSANYDVGHLVGTGGGGIATLNSPCNAATKARGLTGSPSPVGDPFDIDYVAHELGHQFGGNHTFNSTTGACSGNRAGSAAFEPGSGATIQAYAGICGTQDLQRNSDDYFHVRSLEEMVTFISGTACDVELATGNAAPSVSAAPACTIPQDTPFELTGSATDANADALTYIWEEYDLGAANNSIPNSDAGGAIPIFRSYKPSAGGATRSFPSLPFILNNANVPPGSFAGTNSVGTLCAFGSCLTGELLPTINRTMQFQLVVRDNRAGGGGVSSAQTAVTVVESSGGTTFGPFAVTSPNTAVSYNGLTSQTITWNEANTTVAPVSCANVDILISTNGGTTFSTLLAGTPNDGSQNVTIPNVGTTTARIKVKCSTSCFFDISNSNFTITTVTSAAASLGGRVVTGQGSGLNGAIVTVTDANGNTRIARTGSLGYYRFEELAVGQTYILTVRRKGYAFVQPTMFVTLNEDFSEANFVGEMP